MSNLRRIRLERGLTQKELGAKLNTTDVSISRYETEDHRLTLPLLRRLAPALDCTVAELIEDTGDDEDSIVTSADLPTITRFDDEPIYVRVLHTQPGMGNPAVFEEYDAGEQIGFPRALLKPLAALPEHLRVVQVKGTSMAPTLQHLDWVLISLADRSPSQPGIFVLWDGYGEVCKWVERIPHSDPPRVRISSENPRFAPYEGIDVLRARMGPLRRPGRRHGAGRRSRSRRAADRRQRRPGL